MTEPAPAGEPGGEAPISEEEAQALMGQSLQEIGIEPAAAPAGGEVEPNGEGIDISPEELALFEQAMQQAGLETFGDLCSAVGPAGMKRRSRRPISCWRSIMLKGASG